MKIEGRLMQARFNEIYQILAKKMMVGYFSNTVIHCTRSFLRNYVLISKEF